MIGTTKKDEYIHFGYLTYIKEDNLRNCEVYSLMSGNTFAVSGYTGTHFMIDPQNQLFLFIGGNRINKRLSRCDDSCYRENSGLIFSGDYIYEKDKLRDVCCSYALTYV